MPFKPSRIVSIDVFRAITMIVMIFVNDLYTVSGVPHWLEHAAFDENMLGFSDLVFPAFLFVMGMSIPLAIESKLQKGSSKLEVLESIISRTVALLVMGLFTVNYSSFATTGGLTKPVFGLLMLVGFALVWNVYPTPKSELMANLQRGLKIVGIILLVSLIYVYRDGNGGMFQQRWWGILGLIGWAYSFAAVIYLYNRHRPKILMVSYLAFIVLNILGSSKCLGAFNGLIPDNGCFQAFAMTGVLLTLLLRHSSLKYDINRRLSFAVLAGIGLLLLGLVSNNFWIVSKLQATPTWLFYCTGISVLLYVAIYWLIDIKEKGCWFNIIKPAGTATLTCYLVSYLFYALLSLSDLKFPDLLLVSPIGLLKCLTVALVVTGMTALLGKMGIKLKI